MFVVANHWSSKGGDDPLFGPIQPPVQSSEPKRTQQAQAVAGFVDEITPSTRVRTSSSMGDLNDFEYSDSVTTLTDDGSRLLDLPSTLSDDQRYSYVYEGNSQVLDHIALSPALAARDTTTTSYTSMRSSTTRRATTTRSSSTFSSVSRMWT